MTKVDRNVFLPQVIDCWGGIDNWISGARHRWTPYGRARTFLHNSSHPAAICQWIKSRLARSGRVRVVAANAIILLACRRYSGAPSRTYESQQIRGLGVVVAKENGVVAASISTWDLWSACNEATTEACNNDIQHSDIETRMFWVNGHYAKVKECRWCSEPVQFKEHWKEFDGSVRCNRRDCRRMDYLRYLPQSRGGIDLTPRQRQAIDRSAWDTQKTINYLALVAKEQKRGRNSNHDVRRHPARNHRHDHASA